MAHSAGNQTFSLPCSSSALAAPVARLPVPCHLRAGNLVALLAEDLGSIGRAVGRQLLRTRRPFTATVLSPDGELPAACSPPPLLLAPRCRCCWHAEAA